MKRLILVLIFLLAVGLRFYHLNQVPPSLYWDEVSLGLNARTIAETGRDEHGVFMPLTYFAAFGDYKPPGYIYAIVPFIKFLGPTELAVRLPSALSGSLLVLVTFFLVKEILNISHAKLKSRSTKIALVASLFVAISPWSIQMSRAAFEANLATLLTAVGALFFLLAVRHKSLWRFLVSALAFALPFYTFNTHRIFVPMLIAILCILFARQLFGIWKKFLLFLIILLLLVGPLVPHMLSSEGKLRFNEVTWLKNLDLIVASNEKIAEHGNNPLAKLIYNRRIFYAQEFTKHYLDHFSPDFLFLTGDVNPRLSTRAVGEMYLVEALFVILGLFALIKFRSKGTLLILLWTGAALIPASFARETPHALRILNVLPMPQLICAIGLIYIVKKIRLLSVIVPVVYILSAWLYLQNYYFVYPKAYGWDWQYGYKQMVEYVKTEELNYDKINVTAQYGRPYIYFLFYGQVPLDDYLRTRHAIKDNFGFWQVDSFGKYDFIERSKVGAKWLYVRKAEDTPKNSSKKIIYDLDNKPTFAITDEL